MDQEEKELAAAASDQSRLLGRGRRDPGRLLREEKMRKRVTREKPKVCALQIFKKDTLLNDNFSWNKNYYELFLPGN